MISLFTMMISFLLAPFFLVASVEQLNLNPELSKVTATCKISKKSKSTVYFFKQWHLSSGVDTRNDKKSHPQEKNLEAIYLQIDSWIRDEKIKTLVAEGCTGIINENSSYRVNGWTVKDLQSEKSQPSFEKIGTSVPLKLEAKYGSKINTVCGDSEELVKEQLLGFSDARGDIGYLTRIQQYKNDPIKLKPYLSDAISLFQLSETASADEVIVAIKNDLKKVLQRIHKTIEKRNQNLVNVILSSNSKNIAVVYGGIHGSGVKKLLEEQEVNCFILEPNGYQNDEAQLLSRLEDAVRSL